MTVYGISHCTCRSPNIAPDLPLEWQFHRFLLWQLIFHSYFESSSFGRPGPGRSTPSIQWWFHRFLWNSYFIPTLRAQHLADKFLADVPLSNGNFTNSCSTLKAHIWQTKCWQINLESNGNFTDSCSDSSYFIPTLRAPHLADQVLADLPPIINGNFTDSCSTLKAHIFQLRSTLRALPLAHIWQTKSWQIYPHIKWWFHRFLWNSYFIPTLRAQHLADQVLADLPPPITYWFHRWLFIGSHAVPADLTLAPQADLPPNQMAISQIPALTAHISWQLIFHSYSESSTFGRPGLGRSTPIWVAISLIPTLTTLISFLLWELIIWQTRSWHIYPPINGDLQIPTSLRAHIWQTRSWQIYPPIKWQFHRFCSDSSYFIPTLRAHHLADQVLADLPPSNGNFTDSCSTLTAHIWAQTKCWQINPPIKWQFHRFLLWQLTTLRAQYLADQVLADLPPSNGNFTNSCSTLRAPYLADQVIWQISWFIRSLALRAHIWQPGLGRSTPFIRWQFHRFHRFHSYSESSTFGWPGVGRSTPHKILIS